MSDLKLALTYLRTRPLVTFLTVASVALGIALATIVLMLSREAQGALRGEADRWDLVVGAKGSPLQLVLNSLYYLDAPTGKIETDVWNRMEAEPIVKEIVPIVLGDSYYGAPIVGTTPAFFQERTAASGGPLVAKGALFAKPGEVVVGAELASRFRLSLWEKIVSSHGWGQSGGDEHKDNQLTVVGVLAPTGTSLDRAIYTDYQGIWEAHEHGEHGEGHDEHADAHADTQAAGPHEGPGVTALLVRLTQRVRRLQYVEDVNLHLPAMATIPAEQIYNVTTTFIEPFQHVLLIIAYLVVLVSAFSILISLYLTIHQRRRDVAIMRSLGATRGDIFRLITLEAALLAGVGVVAGWLLGHLVVAAAAPMLLASYGIAPNAWAISPVEIVVAASVWVLGMFAGLLPAAMAYRLPVAETLIAE